MILCDNKLRISLKELKVNDQPPDTGHRPINKISNVGARIFSMGIAENVCLSHLQASHKKSKIDPLTNHEGGRSGSGTLKTVNEISMSSFLFLIFQHLAKSLSSHGKEISLLSYNLDFSIRSLSFV